MRLGVATDHGGFDLEHERDLGSLMQRFPAAVRALITARGALGDAREALLARDRIKTVITMA